MLDPGTTLAHYRIAGKIGEGGMGVVLLADDTRLGRQVALKLLPEEFARDAERLARFEREARLLASLNHPNIAAIHGIEEAAPSSDTSGRSQRFLVLELVPGESLAERLGRGPLPLDEALGIARQVAEAVSAAHAAGVLHRDLKPGNVKVTPDGRVKVLDFGLAKSLGAETASGADPSLSPTLTAMGTQAGVILGTAAYMSPEQARGRPLDRRADVWAFGCTLWEMLAGRRLFVGDTVSDTLAAVLREEPDWSAIPPGIPSPVRRLLRRCLAKDPARRLSDLADARLEIDEAGEAQEAVAEAAGGDRSRLRMLIPWAVALLASIVAGWFAILAVASARAPVRRIVASIPPPTAEGFSVDHGLALSPDGRQLAFVARGEDGLERLWLHRLERGVSEPLQGTEGGRYPFWSPDGRQLAFLDGERLRRLEVESGVLESLDESERWFGGSWGRSGRIVFGGSWGEPFWNIPAGGGERLPLATLGQAGGDLPMWPWFLPDGERFLYLLRRYGSDQRTGQIRLAALDGSPSTPVLDANSNPVYVPPGIILWWHDGNLRGRRFDPGAGELRGEPFVVAAGVRFDPRPGYAPFTASGNGVLVYQEGGELRGNELAWLDRGGRELGTVGAPGSYYGPRLSPDGSRIATDLSDETNRGDIWLLDAVRGSGTRFSSFPEDDSAVVWSPDGEQVAFFSMQGGDHAAIYARAVRGSDPPRLLLEQPDAGCEPLSWRGDALLFVRDTPEKGADLWVYSVSDGETRPVVATPFNEPAGDLSPDGRELVFTSDETGRPEIYLQGFPEAGERLIVSADGGSQPRWGPDGDEIYYLAPDGRLMAVPVVSRGGAGTRIATGEPEALFRVDIKEHDKPQYDTVDGRRFLVNRNLREGADRPLTLVVGWDAGLAD